MIETVSGRCPACGYDKLIIRCGTGVINSVEGCASCGFGYSVAAKDKSLPVGPDAWIDYAIHILNMSSAPELDSSLSTKLSTGVDMLNDPEFHEFNEKFFEFVNKSKLELSSLGNIEILRKLKLYLDSIDRDDSIEGTVFIYSDDEISTFMNNNMIK